MTSSQKGELYGLNDLFKRCITYIDKKSLTFFDIHTKVEHSDAAESLLKKVWAENLKNVIDGFTFTYNYQVKM